MCAGVAYGALRSYDPRKRLSAAAAVKHAYFADLARTDGDPLLTRPPTPKFSPTPTTAMAASGASPTGPAAAASSPTKQVRVRVYV